MKNILLVGETGSGKSSLANYVVGIPDAFQVSDDAESCTKDTIRKISQLDPLIGVVDTPGLQDSSGSDSIHYEQMLKIIKEMKDLHFILVVLNYTCPRFTSSIQYMIKFLCNVFPKNFAHHIGIIFTHYDHDYLMKISKKKKDPRENRQNVIKKIMELISQTTNEELFLGPPVYYLDSYIGDDNSKAELYRLIAFAKSLNPIEDIRHNCSLKYKSQKEEFKTFQYDLTEGDYIVTYTEKKRRINYTDYNGNVIPGEWETLSTDKSYRSLPVRTEWRTEYIYRDEEKKEEKEKNQEENKSEGKKEETAGDQDKKKEICDKFVEGGTLGVIGTGLLTVAGACLSPFCPAVGVPMMYTGLAGMGVSETAQLGGLVAGEFV